MGKSIDTFVKGFGPANNIPTGIDFARADMKTEAGRREVSKAINEYFSDVRSKSTRGGHLINLPSTPDIDVRHYTKQPDLGVLDLFRPVDRKQSKNPTHQFANVNAASVIFRQKKEGEPAEIAKVTDSAPTSVSSVTWEGALGITDEEKRFDEYGTFEANVQGVPTLYDDAIASNYASLFTAAGAGINETWVTDLITTINNGAAQILEDVGDIYGVGDNATFGLLYNHRRWNDVLKALTSNLTLPNDNNSARQLQFDIAPIKTRRITTASLYLVLPGYDLVDITWDDLFSEENRDAKRGADELIWRARRTGAIGNVNQVRRITPA